MPKVMYSAERIKINLAEKTEETIAKAKIKRNQISMVNTEIIRHRERLDYLRRKKERFINDLYELDRFIRINEKYLEEFKKTTT